MFSKGMPSLLALILSSVLLLGCQKFLQAPESDTSRSDNGDTVVVPTGELACLKATPTQLQNFLDDEGDSRNLEEGIGCIQSSLKTFMKYARGTKADSYTAKELQHFFNKYLLKQNKISPQFANEIMKLKVMAIGGTPETTTRAELEQFSQFLGDVKTVSLKLHGKLKLIFFRRDRAKVAAVEIEEAQAALQEFATKILDRSKVTSSRYQWVDMISFLKELNTFVGDSKGLKTVLKWVPLAESVKLLFIGENAKLLTDQEWRTSVRWVVNTYSVILKFYYQIRGHEFDSPREWTKLMAWMDDVFQGIEASPVMKEKKLLDALAIDRLMDELYELKLFKTEIGLELMKATYRKGLVHLIDGLPGQHADPQYVAGLTLKHFRVLKHEYNVWKLSQTFLNEVYSKNKVVTIKVLLAAVPQFDIKTHIHQFTKEKLEIQDLAQSWIDYVALLATDRPVTYDVQSKVQLLSNLNTVATQFAGMNLANFIRSVTRRLIFGYGEKQMNILFDNRISMAGLIRLEEDFKDFAQELGFIDPRHPGSAKRTFEQANFFTFHGNGDQWMSSLETFEEIAMLISGGRQMAGDVVEDLGKRGCQTTDLDIFRKPIFDEACFYKQFRGNADVYLNNMIGMKTFVGKLSDQQYLEFYENMMLVSRLNPEFHKAGRLEYAEIRNMTTVLHYIESLMIVYDLNRNNILDETELKMAVPRFQSYIAAAHPSGADYAEDIFLYLVYKGAKPKGKLDILNFKIDRAFSFGGVGRLNLIKIIGVLKKDSK